MKITATGNTVREKELRRQGEKEENSPGTAMAAGGKGDSNVKRMKNADDGGNRKKK